MQLDYSIEYDSSFDKFKGESVLRIMNGPLWITLYTDKAKEFMKKNYPYYNDSFGKGIIKFDNVEGTFIHHLLSSCKKLSGSFGGFYFDRFINRLNDIVN